MKEQTNVSRIWHERTRWNIFATILQPYALKTRWKCICNHFPTKKTHIIAQKGMFAQRYTLGKYVTSVCLDCLFQVQNWLNLKQKDCKAIIKKNHAALEKNPLKTDLSGKRSWCYILHIEKATSKTATQQTSYINNLQLSQAHLRSKCSVRENYLVLLLMLALVTTSESWSIQFLLEELLKNVNETCVLCNVSCLPKGRQM